LCEQCLWPKWLRRRGEVVVYSPLGETLAEERVRFPSGVLGDRPPGDGWFDSFAASVWQAGAYPDRFFS